MKQAPVAPDDADRVAALRSYDVLDTAREDSLQNVVRLVAQVCRTPVAVISLVDDHRMWVKARHGEFADVVERALSFCGHAIAEPGVAFVVDDARCDPRFADNPLVVGDPFIRFYAGVPLVSGEGYALGVLCVIDFVPRSLANDERATLELGARCVVSWLEERRARGRLDRALGERRKLANANRHLAGEIERRSALEARLAFAARHDELTTLPNRGYFVERLRARVAVDPATRARSPFAVMFVDIDHFKSVNDTYGHLVGDELLVAVARRLSHFVRGNDIVARLGGDEFTVLIDVVTELDALANLAQRLGNAIAVPFRLERAEVAVSASIGIVVASETYLRAEDVLRDADAAMFAAKAAGRDRFEFFRGDVRPLASS